MWNGDLEKSAVLLERYRKIAGADADYKKAKVQLLVDENLAYENQYASTVKAADDVLLTAPDDCNALMGKTAALGALRQPAPMLASLSSVDAYCHEKAAAWTLDRSQTTPLRSYVNGNFTYSTDSDTVEIGTYTLNGRYALTPETYFLLGAETGWLQASTTSGLETAQSQSRIDQSAAWAGVEKMISSNLWLNGRLGYHEPAMILRQRRSCMAAPSIAPAIAGRLTTMSTMISIPYRPSLFPKASNSQITSCRDHGAPATAIQWA